MTLEDQFRIAARTIYDNMNSTRPRREPPPYLDLRRAHSINLLSDDFVSGYTENGRMSAVRRFFCLFVTFDLVFTSLLWIISITVKGDNIYDALKKQILHYAISSSFFDIVVIALCRFIVLLLFYAWFRMKHWLVIALSTSGSCAFLILKVFAFNWMPSGEPVIKVIIIVSSFVLAWGEAWFLDCRVLPQEHHARTYLSVVNSTLPSDRSPLIAPILTFGAPPSESIENFYSPYESAPNSDSEDEEQVCDDNMQITCVDANHPGSSHDSFVSGRSQLRQRLMTDYQNAVRNSWLLGDFGYPLMPFLITPFRTPESNRETKFNELHAKTRSIIERTIGAIKNTFRYTLGARQAHYKPEEATQIINVCCALHNLRLKYGLPADEFLDADVEHNREDTPMENDSEETEQEIRQQLLRALFL